MDPKVLRPAREKDAPKNVYLKPYHFDEHGYTEVCEGCRRLASGLARRQHQEACWTRIYAESGKTKEAGKPRGGAGEEKKAKQSERQEAESKPF